MAVSEATKDEIIRLYVHLDTHDRNLVDEFIDALIAGDMAKCDRMMWEAQSRQGRSI